MTITATKLTDNDFNIIVKANGVGSEDEQTREVECAGWSWRLSLTPRPAAPRRAPRLA